MGYGAEYNTYGPFAGTVVTVTGTDITSLIDYGGLMETRSPGSTVFSGTTLTSGTYDYAYHLIYDIIYNAPDTLIMMDSTHSDAFETDLDYLYIGPGNSPVDDGFPHSTVASQVIQLGDRLGYAGDQVSDTTIVRDKLNVGNMSANLRSGGTNISPTSSGVWYSPSYAGILFSVPFGVSTKCRFDADESCEVKLTLSTTLSGAQTDVATGELLSDGSITLEYNETVAAGDYRYGRPYIKGNTSLHIAYDFWYVGGIN